MKINRTSKIDDDGGDWLILTDWGSDGMSVTSQHESPEEALKFLGSDSGGSPQAIVKLSDFKFSVEE